MPIRPKPIAGRLKDITRTFRVIWSASNRWTMAWIALLVVQGLLPVASVRLTKEVVNGLTSAVGSGSGWTAFRPILVPAGLMAGVFLLTELLQVCIEWIRAVQSELVQDHIAGLVHEKSMAVDMGFYEMSEFHNRLHRARSDATTRPLVLLESSGSALQNGITLVAMAAVLVPYGLWMPAALVLSTIPAFYAVVRASKRQHLWWNDTTVTRRRIQYFDSLLTESFYAGELRLFGLGAHFRGIYQTLRKQFRNERFALMKAQYQSRLGAELVALVISGTAMLWMVRQALLRTITLGDLALFYQAFQRGQGLVRTLLSNVGQIYSQSLYLGNVFEFLDLEPQIVDAPDAVTAPTDLRSSITFTNVSFKYPGGRSLSLRNCSATIPAGKIVAVVGPNGAGKTTLLKLIARFYDPESGSVQVDGIDVRRFSLTSLRRLLTFMFQVPGNYQLTARENIAVGGLQAASEPGRVESAAWSAGAHQIIQRLPKGYESVLGRWFPDGTELSGGEWQRVALARAFVRQAHVMLLDEPTSAMDSWSESDWYTRLRHLAEGRTVLLATHRLTIAMRADLILVMSGGRVVESGSHEELLNIGGLYAESWTNQSRSSVVASQVPAATA